ncbi:MAG: hypothetical protein KJ063_02575 [Anaerolineae bacterium]|nr:hypothetical protein [Anaerolineae bacterium]
MTEQPSLQSWKTSGFALMFYDQATGNQIEEMWLPAGLPIPGDIIIFANGTAWRVEGRFYIVPSDDKPPGTDMPLIQYYVGQLAAELLCQHPLA